MADYGEYQSSSQAAASLAMNSRYSQHSGAPSTQSWMPPKHRMSSVPPPQPVNLPTPVQTLRPLPIPNANRASSAHSSARLRVVNTDPPTAQLEHFLQRNVVESDSGTATSGTPQTRRMWSLSSSGDRPRLRKKKSFVGGFFKGVKKLPRTMFGYGAGMGMSSKSKLKYSDPMTEGTSASEMTGNTLPAYSSNPSSPVVRVPGRSRLNMQHFGDMISTQPTIPESSVPSVVRVDEQRHSNIPSVRVTPPSGTYDENANMYGETETEYPDYPGSDPSADNPDGRTTFMVYNDHNSYYYDQNHPPPRSVHRQASTSPVLSYVDQERSGSLHSSAAPSTVRDPRLPVDSAQSATEPGSRVSYASPIPFHAASNATPVGALQLSSAPTAQPLSQAQMSPQNQVVQAATTADPPAQHVGSPLSVHPEPTEDYRKMTLSPAPTSHDTYTTATSYYDPSFSSLNPIEKFFKMLYHMPWVSHDRVTVDYLPGEGASKGRKKRSKPVASWYHGMLGNSRRSSTTLDLLSSGTPSATSPGTSVRASLAMAMGSPRSPRNGQQRQSADRQKSRHHRSRRHQLSSHHRHPRHMDDSRKRKRDTGTSMGTTNTDSNPKKPTSSPLIPSAYPFQYPPYPYPAFSTFPVPAPMPAAVAGQPSQLGGHRTTPPRGPRSASQQPMVYAAPTGYSPYQPMMGAPQVYLLQPTSPPQAPKPVPASLVPGVSHDRHSHDQATQLPNLQKGDNSQRQSIPGAF